MSTITPEDVKYIASLSRIHLRDEEIASLNTNLERILDYIEKLNKADISKVEATSHVLPVKNVFRKDKARPSLKQDEALQIAVEKHAGAFKVPKVIE
jgi:aspartyl-tRNA(Asn)/glutamyl-tRNA(Gln) amidotransferase subunit C